MILNRLDVDQKDGAGVGNMLLERGHHDGEEIVALAEILGLRREIFGPGVFVIDAGANIGTHTITWARMMTEWGSVMAIEPQERVFYALAGNIALNNCFNAAAHMAAVSDKPGRVAVPRLDHRYPANFGGVTLRPGANEQGNVIGMAFVPAVVIDDLNVPRLDLFKIDVEGMEPQALDGARRTIERCRPMIYAEDMICGREAIASRLPSYELVNAADGRSVVAIHRDDPIRQRLRFVEQEAA